MTSAWVFGFTSMPIAPGVLFQPQPTSRIFRFGVPSPNKLFSRSVANERREGSEVTSHNRNVELGAQFFETHPIQHHGLVAFERDARHDCEITRHLVTRGEKVAARQKSGH